MAAHFNTPPTKSWPKTPACADSTLASGISVMCPAYWFPLAGSAYKIIPDSDFVYGPTSQGFDIDAYVASQPGYLRR